MPSVPSLLALAHLVGLALAVGSATAKLALLLRCRTEPGLVPAFLAVVRPVTRLIILGLALLTLSGAGWLLVGYPFTPRLAVKLVLVAAIWALGPVIDHVAEPAFRRLAPGPGEPPSPGFLRASARYLRLEALATGLFYVIVVLWVLP
jgi:hypothetical protein